ncbi:hypothetical protein CL60_gp23 [Mycobacterium phage BarrelRoll]|uniref:Uncharacterized protein n=1 Tax=Mycobacterium phage BarrelRoll TaxID=1084722 RepID=G3MCM8_9CAUD|nr:hypothetical protein CL60_gp23 [Mycobacterium phage BarrelRoll]ASR87591.1 hypothetical protein SEA_SLIMPHAZIE_79 [Mycobacterium phage Slimphazie]QFG14631.1 hypothetical protein SEA_RAPUNZEL97_80 [Mycobacterium phage Rapunzel97]WNM73570.1 hypothetical protein SEA_TRUFFULATREE_79 [Mycobacterium Phage TruffulaTree]WNO27464.1 hypothetical protein SEA_CHEETODUST_77 [Mycobacterium phage CheetoDust]AEO94217.1 hypothetical protein BARRELROLL_78 [Mycobacterium phage BarrelRoll]
MSNIIAAAAPAARKFNAAAALNMILGINLSDGQKRARLLALAVSNDAACEFNLAAARKALAAGRLAEADRCVDAADFYNNRAKRLRDEARAI